MSAPAPVAKTAPQAPLPVRVKEVVAPFLAPYYLAIAGVLGALTVGFVVVVVLLMVVAANVNLLGWVE